MPERVHRPELPLTAGDMLLPIERDYAFYFLQLRTRGSENLPVGYADELRTQGIQLRNKISEPDAYESKLRAIRKRIEELGAKQGKSTNEIQEWIQHLEEWALKKVAGEKDAPRAAVSTMPSEKIIVSPSPRRGPLVGSGEGMETPEITNKNERIVALLARLGIPWKAFSDLPQTFEGKKMMRTVPYIEYLLLGGKILLATDQASSQTFVVHNVSFETDAESPPITQIDKDELDARNGIDVDAIPDYKNDLENWTRMLAVTLQHSGGGAAGWKSGRDTAMEIGVGYENLKAYVDAACQKDPALKNLFVALLEKYGDEERIVTQYTAECRKRLKAFLEEENKTPENMWDVNGIIDSIFDALGGEAVVGAPLAGVRQDLFHMVFKEVVNKKDRKIERNKKGTGRMRRTLISRADGDRAIKVIVARKKEDLKYPLKPKNFLADGVQEVAQVVVAENELPPTEKQRIQASIENVLQCQLAKYIQTYNPESAEGNFGIFRASPLGHAVKMFTPELARTIQELYKKRIIDNRKLPAWEKGDKKLGAVVDDFLATHGEFSFRKTELYLFIFNTLQLRDPAWRATPFKQVGGGVIKKTVKRLYDGLPSIVASTEAQKKIKELLEEKCKKESAVPSAGESDVSLVDLIRTVAARLRAQGIKKGEDILSVRIKAEFSRVQALGISAVGCGEKRVKSNQLDHGMFYTKEIAKIIQENIVHSYSTH